MGCWRLEARPSELGRAVKVSICSANQTGGWSRTVCSIESNQTAKIASPSKTEDCSVTEGTATVVSRTKEVSIGVLNQWTTAEREPGTRNEAGQSSKDTVRRDSKEQPRVHAATNRAVKVSVGQLAAKLKG